MHQAVEKRSINITTSSRRERLITGAIAAMVCCLCPTLTHAEDVSQTTILQIFDASWETVEQRSVDMFYAGYGAIWLPPPGRADSGDQSVGYDVYDRFDLGDENRSTGYGTETGLKTAIESAHNAGISVYTDLILNHNGFSDLSTYDGSNSFLDAGGYPGFVLSTDGDVDGDFHGAYESGDLNGRLSGLIDIAQEKTIAYIRHPVDPDDPNNIPAGTTPAFGRIANVPTASNAQYYPDLDSPGTVLDVDPGPGEYLITRYNFNTSDPMAGDATVETAEQMLMRYSQWMIQVIGVDGFRIDAAKHFPESTLDMLDQAVYAASNTIQHDGTIKPIYSFSEVLDGNTGTVQTYINRGLTNQYGIDTSDNEVQGNRDALDFSLFFALRNNLTGNGYANNWHNIRNAGQDLADDGLRNGSQGVSFVGSHDDLAGGFPYLENVAYAYTLMLPGQAIVYHNAEEFGGGREFPNDGRDDALGGYSSDTITTLLDIRNSHGRGDFHERWLDDAFNPSGFSNIYIYERENSAIIGLSSRLDNYIETRSGVQTGFEPGVHLVELTGNADDVNIDPGDNIPNTIVVDGSGQVTIKIPANATHGKGYVIYGLAAPEVSMSLTNVDSTDAGVGSASTSATAVIGDVDVIKSSTFTIRLDSSAVTLPDGWRDYDADGDFAAFKIDEGYDANGNGAVDFVTPGSVVYGFERFLTTNTPGYIDNGSGTNIGTGTGVYEQVIDATQLSEGYHYITGRTFRHRDSGPAIYDDQKRVVYIDLLPPESAIDSFELNGGGTGDMDLVMSSVDLTAAAIFVYIDLPANISEEDILDINPSQNATLQIDRDLFRREFLNVKDGNHVITLLTVESTGTYNIQRFAGMYTSGANGAGFGDLNSDNVLSPSDLTAAPGGFEDILYSQNDKFHAAADVTGDGLVDNRDLFALEDELLSGGADQSTMDAFEQVLLGRGDLNNDSLTDASDIDMLRLQFGSTDWLYDLDVNGLTDSDDEVVLLENIFKTTYGDVDLDGDVDQQDLDIAMQYNGVTGTGWATGDMNNDGTTGFEDMQIILANFTAILGDLNSDGFVGLDDLDIVLANWNQSVPPSDSRADPSGDGYVGLDDLDIVLANWNAGTPPGSNANIPEPTTFVLLALGLTFAYRRH